MIGGIFMSSKQHLTKYEIPTATTQSALIIAEAKEEGLIPDNSSVFDNVDDLVKSLEEDE